MQNTDSKRNKLSRKQGESSRVSKRFVDVKINSILARIGEDYLRIHFVTPCTLDIDVKSVTIRDNSFASFGVG